MINYLIFILCFFFAYLFLNEYYYKVVLYETQEHEIMRGKEKSNLDWIAFGSSYCRYGLVSCEGGFNFGVAAQFLYYSDKMLREYATPCLKKNGTVYLIIANLVFAEVGRGIYGADRYQELLSKKTLSREYSLLKRLSLRFPLFFHPRQLKKLIDYSIKGIRSDYDTVTKNNLTEKQVTLTAKARCESWCEQFHLNNTQCDVISKELEEKFSETRDILTGMIQFCLDNKLKPILVVTPVSKIMRSMLSDAFLNKVLFNNITLANKQNVPFLNYLDDEEFQNDLSLYYNNSDFLNARGRKIFTKKLINDTQLL